MKLALVSTPRAGNTWLRYMLAGLYQLEQHAVHTPDAIDWAGLPPRCIVQLHWRHSPEFAELLAAQGFRVVTIARHPLDVLLSILQFSTNETQTTQWLAGAGGDELAIRGRSADSTEFLLYATGPRARALLSVTPDWWVQPGVLGVRYEDLVRDPLQGLQPVLEALGPVLTPLAQVLPTVSIDRLRQTSVNNHFWKGQPGHWRELLPMDTARLIQATQADLFRCLGYSVDSGD